MKRNTFRKISTMLVIAVFAVNFSGCLKQTTIPKSAVSLEFWGVFDDSTAYNNAIDEYRKMDSIVSDIRYKKFNVNEYRNDLIDALAAGNGPDIFMINSAWIPDFENKIAFAPKEVFGEKEFRDTFVDVAANDLLSSNGEVMGTTLSVDSLALYYNKDIFNAVGVTAPPKTWEEFVDIAKKTTRISDTGDILQSGAAMGSVNNINRATDVIDMLLFQNGVSLPQRNNGIVNLNQTIRTKDDTVSGGSNALEFYTRFANSNSPTYTWSSDESMHYSLDEFYEGDLAMMFNFSWHYETIKSKNSKLNFAVTTIPQLNPNSPANTSNYWVLVVSKNKIQGDSGSGVAVSNETRTLEAWQFLKFLTAKNNGQFGLINPLTGEKVTYTMSSDPAKDYVIQTNKPAARRDIIEEQKNDPFLGPFVQGNLIAKSWIRNNSDSIESVWGDVVSEINKGGTTVGQGLNIANTRINNFLTK
ncbi:MAG: extracellular solute-binding protein [Candidatus Moranbacteria bacterium]|nr:extracellular solute-binding protein [Candidatus Moranbacteria bacterium]